MQCVAVETEDYVETFSNLAYDKWQEDDKSPTLRNSGGIYGGGSEVIKLSKTVVRRLTPKECNRLQGFVDGWLDFPNGEWTDSKGKVHKESDTAKYKALGNSIQVNSWAWVLRNMRECILRDNGADYVPTMASLFDGIGGFPLCWEALNGEGTCLWASEIEEFPMAVTKLRFPDKEEKDEQQT